MSKIKRRKWHGSSLVFKFWLAVQDFINCSLPVLLFAKVYEASCAGLSEVKEADGKCLGWRCGQTHFS
jgi:hypothetical protein